jgi:hypothetical protein
MSHGLPTNELNKRRGADLSACRGLFQEGPEADLITTGDGLMSCCEVRRYVRKYNILLRTRTHARLVSDRLQSIGDWNDGEEKFF